MFVMTNLTQQQVDYMEDHVKRKLGCEEGQEPLRSIHMGLQTHIQEMVVQIRYILLKRQTRINKQNLNDMQVQKNRRSI